MSDLRSQVGEGHDSKSTLLRTCSLKSATSRKYIHCGIAGHNHRLSKMSGRSERDISESFGIWHHLHFHIRARGQSCGGAPLF